MCIRSFGCIAFIRMCADVNACVSGGMHVIHVCIYVCVHGRVQGACVYEFNVSCVAHTHVCLHACIYMHCDVLCRDVMTHMYVRVCVSCVNAIYVCNACIYVCVYGCMHVFVQCMNACAHVYI